MLKKAGLLAVLLSISFLLGSCARVQKETPPELYWPFPPEKPRIKFVDSIVGSIDATGVRSGLAKVIFGEEQEFRFAKPISVAVKNGVMYVTDIGVIHIYDFPKKAYRVISGYLLNTTGVAVAADGTLYVGDSGRKQVFMMRPKSNIWEKIDSPGTFETPGELVLDEINGRLIVPDAKKHVVRVYDMEGKFIFSIGGRGGEPGRFNFPYAAAVDREGRIYISDSGNFRVQVFDRDGKFISAFGGVGSSAGNFARPKGIAVDSEGHIYVVDSAFGNFQIFDPDGNIYLAVGTSGQDAGKFLLPSGIAIDENDKVYVVDQMNMRIQIFQYLKYPKEVTEGP